MNSFLNKVIAAGLFAVSCSASAQQFTGNTKLACEALLCLPFLATAPGECSKAITKYFLILNPVKRVNFLRLCPAASVPNANPAVEDVIKTSQGVQAPNNVSIQAEVFSCSDARADPAFSASFDAPSSVPDGYVEYSGNTVIAQASGGYANSEQFYKGSSLGFGFGVRARANVRDSYGNVAVGDWEFQSANGSCNIDASRNFVARKP